MTNKQRYQRVFSQLHASESCLTEVTKMKHTTKRIQVRRLAAACAAAIMVMGMATVAYAADVGGIQRTVQLWINGDLTDAILYLQDMGYTFTFQDQDGTSHEVKGGGVAIDDDGVERSLTEEEILADLDAPNVEYKEDGSVWVYYHDSKVDITDRFDEDGICYVQLKTDSGILYLTIKYQDGFASSPHRYPSPKKFGTTAD